MSKLVAFSILLLFIARASFGEAFCGADAIFGGLKGTNAPPPLRQSLALVLQGTENLERWVVSRNLKDVHNEDPLLALGLAGLQQQMTGLQKYLGDFADTLSALHMSADVGLTTSADAGVERLHQSLLRLMEHFPAADLDEALQLAERRSCHFHADEIGQKGGKCFKCGSRLSRPVPITREFGLIALGNPQRIIATIPAAPPLTNGIERTHTLRLTLANQLPLTPAKLIRAHGERVHLFLLDSSFTDYHHVHPRAARKPGEYEFEFAPRKPGPYRMWVELHVAPFGFRQYASLDLPGRGSGEAKTAADRQTTFEQDGIKYELLTGELRAGVASRLKLRVTQDGKPCAQLEPFMEAFAHLVGFGENYRTILHTHPLMTAVTNTAARGGPELEFQILPTEPGNMTFFAQVKINGQMKTAPFHLRVAREQEGEKLTLR
jgi:hypothetical protein